MTTPMATGPMFLIISVIVNVLPPAGLAVGLAAASCNKKITTPKTFVPRRLIRIVTVNPSKGFSEHYFCTSRNRVGPVGRWQMILHQPTVIEPRSYTESRH